MDRVRTLRILVHEEAAVLVELYKLEEFALQNVHRLGASECAEAAIGIELPAFHRRRRAEDISGMPFNETVGCSNRSCRPFRLHPRRRHSPIEVERNQRTAGARNRIWRWR